jgi:hypothetical protein
MIAPLAELSDLGPGDEQRIVEARILRAGEAGKASSGH